MKARGSRTGRGAIWVAPVAIAAAVAILAVDASLGATVYAIPVALAIVVAAVQAVAIPFALVRPAWAAFVGIAGLATSALLIAPTPDAPWPVSVGATIAFAVTLGIVGVFARWRVGVTAWGVGVAATLLVATVRDHGDAAAGAVAADLIVFASVTAVAVASGIVARSWRDVRRLLAQEREVSAAEAARRGLAEERNRIARELHDIVAHGMSAIQVRAASARYRMPELPAEAAAEFDELAATSRAAMGEMRRLLGILREEDAADSAPQPGLRELPDLLKRSSHGGALSVDDSLPRGHALDPLVELTVYRVVQESLSNVARHAPGADVRVALAADDAGAVLVEVRNTRSPGGLQRPSEPGGLGLRGMRERVELAGGALAAGRTVDGGFAVRARIPPSALPPAAHPPAPRPPTPAPADPAVEEA